MFVLLTHTHTLTHTLAHTFTQTQGNVQLPKIVAVGVTILGRGTRLVSGEVGLRLAAQLHSLQASVPPEVVQVRARACVYVWCLIIYVCVYVRVCMFVYMRACV
jgi:hypothetical protein